jgi:hypothetical protein
MRSHLLLALFIAASAAVNLARAADNPLPKKDDSLNDKGFESIFDGKTLKGWHISAKSGHSAKSGFKSGGKWVVEDGVIVGSQDIAGNGGILITDAEYGNLEVVLEMKNDFGPDSGLFVRSNDKGQAHQAMIDYHKDGNLMGFYGEGLTPSYDSKNFSFKDKVTDIVEVKNAFPLPVSPEQWPDFWRHGEWNELRVRITGNPAKMTSWIKGVKFMEYQDTVKRMDKGGIALQIHGGTAASTTQFVRYRNIRIKVLE